MLTIHFGEMENVEYGPSWFKYNYKPEWLKDDFVQATANQKLIMG